MSVVLYVLTRNLLLLVLIFILTLVLVLIFADTMETVRR
jgi:hypothetical protein